MNKTESLVGLLENFAQANATLDCVLIRSFDNADCVTLRITAISQNTMTLITNWGFRIVNVSRHLTKDALVLVIRWGFEDI